MSLDATDKVIKYAEELVDYFKGFKGPGITSHVTILNLRRAVEKLRKCRSE